MHTRPIGDSRGAVRQSSPSGGDAGHHPRSQRTFPSSSRARAPSVRRMCPPELRGERRDLLVTLSAVELVRAPDVSGGVTVADNATVPQLLAEPRSSDPECRVVSQLDSNIRDRELGSRRSPSSLTTTSQESPSASSPVSNALHSGASANRSRTRERRLRVTTMAAVRRAYSAAISGEASSEPSSTRTTWSAGSVCASIDPSSVGRCSLSFWKQTTTAIRIGSAVTNRSPRRCP